MNERDRAYITRTALAYANDVDPTGSAWRKFPAWYLAECEAEPEPRYWPSLTYATFERYQAWRRTGA
jgi:hypothetical protein